MRPKRRKTARTACIFSHDDLTINGSGALTVTGNLNDGIHSKDDLIITGGNLSVTAVNDGLKGKGLRSDRRRYPSH